MIAEVVHQANETDTSESNTTKRRFTIEEYGRLVETGILNAGERVELVRLREVAEERELVIRAAFRDHRLDEGQLPFPFGGGNRAALILYYVGVHAWRGLPDARAGTVIVSSGSSQTG